MAQAQDEGRPSEWTPPSSPGVGAPVAPSRSYPYAAPAATVSQPGRRIIEPAKPTPAPLDPASQPTPRRPSAPEPAFDPSGTRTPTFLGSWEALGGDGSQQGRDQWTPIFDAPSEEPAEESAARKFPLVPIIIAAAVVVIAGFVVYQVFGVNRSPDPSILPGGSNPSATGVGFTHPSPLVRDYFAALQDGDVAKAQRFGPVGQGSRVALTERSLRQSLDRLPMTEVSVKDVSDASTEVPVTYKLGGETISTNVQVRKQDGGGFLLLQSTVTVSITARRSLSIPLLVNGEELEANTVEVFPGSYVLTTGLPFLQYEGADFQVSALDDKPEISLLTPALTKRGREALIEVGKQSLDDCLKAQSLAPKGCPFAMEGAGPIEPGSLTWYLLNDPWNEISPRLSSQREIAEVVLDLQLAVSLRYVNSSQGSLNRSPVPTISVALRVDMSKMSTGELKATWER